MPLYELFCLARPQLAKAQMADIIKLAGRTVLDKGGVITDIKSFGDQSLAYEIQRPGERHSHAGMWQLTFAVKPAVLAEIDHTLRVDERILRWVVLKRRPYGALPNPYRVARTAERVEQTLQSGQAAQPAASQPAE